MSDYRQSKLDRTCEHCAAQGVVMHARYIDKYICHLCVENGYTFDKWGQVTKREIARERARYNNPDLNRVSGNRATALRWDDVMYPSITALAEAKGVRYHTAHRWIKRGYKGDADRDNDIRRRRKRAGRPKESQRPENNPGHYLRYSRYLGDKHRD